MSVKELLEVCEGCGIGRGGAVSKEDVVQAIVTSGKVEIVKDAQQITEIAYDELTKMSVKDLKELCSSVGIGRDEMRGFRDKIDFVDAVIRSGRINIIDEKEGEEEGKFMDVDDFEGDNGEGEDTKMEEEEKKEYGNIDSDVSKDDDIDFGVMSIHELKTKAAIYDVDIKGCVEKQEIIDKIRKVIRESHNL